jgi:hypothetical protein
MTAGDACLQIGGRGHLHATPLDRVHTSQPKLTEVVVAVQVLEPAPLPGGQNTKGGVRSERTAVSAPRDKPPQRRPPRGLIGLPDRWLCAPKLRSGGKLPLRPGQHVHQEPPQRVNAQRRPPHGNRLLAKRDPERVNQMTHHLRRTHPTPKRRRSEP